MLLKTVFCCTFWRQKILILWRKIVENLLIFVYLFCPRDGAIDFTKTLITQERLVVESCLTPRWIAFSMLYRLVYNICSHFSGLILAWSALKQAEHSNICHNKIFYKHKHVFSQNMWQVLFRIISKVLELLSKVWNIFITSLILVY